MSALNKAFFCLEGIDGCGKSTQTSKLEEVLQSKGYEVLRIREPGGTQASEKIREVLLNPELSICSMSELMLYSAARAQLIHEVIIPALKAGKVVLADRFAWSTLAYQGYGREIAKEQIQTLNELTCGELWPAKTFVLDIPVEEFRKRSAAEGRTADRMEQEKESFFQKVREGYQAIAQKFSDKVELVEGTQAPEVIHEYLAQTILNQLK